MDLYAHTSSVEALGRTRDAAPGTERAALGLELGWHLRQRAAPRAESLARELEGSFESPAERARLALVRAECALLLARLDDAQARAAEAHMLFGEARDAAGLGDTALVRARIAEARGDRPEELSCYAQALDAYRQCGDPERLAHGRCASLLAHGMGDPAAIEAELAAIRARREAASPAVALHLRFIEGVAAFQRGQLIEAVPALAAVAAQAADWGMCDQAFRAEAGLVSAHSNLGDREASCSLAETALEKARRLGWPRALGHALSNFGRQLADTGQHERAVEIFGEAREVLAGQPRSRGFAITSYYLGDALLALGRHEEALANLELAQARMRDLDALPEVACLLAIQAQALSRLGRPGEALDRARAGLELAGKTGSRLWEAEALRSLAEIHTSHRIGSADAHAAVGFLEQALKVAEAVGGHHEKSQLYTEIARAHESAGDLAAALAAERAARAEEVRESGRRAANRVLLARERHEGERQAERARALESALSTLEQLRQVGQDVTSHLDPAAMLRSLDGHLRRFAEVSFIAVFVFDAPGGRLLRHSIERGRVLPVREVALADFESYAARAARERREIHVDAEEGGRAATRIPGTEVTRSLWFGPLLRGEELLGVLTVQSPRVSAFGDREKLIFRTVAGYAAVAFANARTHGELEAKHRRLIDTEAEMRQLATTDPLTGLANRRQFFASAESELARAMRYGGAMALVMADLDRFKAINDAGGHGAGDRVIEAVARALRQEQRPHDVLARVGGEEFAFVLPGADLDAAVSAAERMRRAVEALEVEYGSARYRVTLSLGCAAVAEARELGGDAASGLEALMRAADAALYEAKRRGRNRSVAASPEGGQAFS